MKEHSILHFDFFFFFFFFFASHHTSSLSQVVHHLSHSLAKSDPLATKACLSFLSRRLMPLTTFFFFFSITFLRCYTNSCLQGSSCARELFPFRVGLGFLCAVTISVPHWASPWMRVIYSIILHVNCMSTLKISLATEVKDNRESRRCFSYKTRVYSFTPRSIKRPEELAY